MQPHSPERPVVTNADLALCRQMIRDGSKSFYMASLLLPQRICDAARSLYGFCRVADDEVDKSTDSAAAVGRLLSRLDRIYAHDPEPYPADRAYADVAWHYAIPRALPEALIEGFAWDATDKRYDSLSDLTAYAVRVAGTVGAMMSIIMQVRDPVAIARACDLGVAMQFTNIARDVGEDARNGRLYLPRAWMVEAGLDADAFMAKPEFSPQLASVIQRLLREADRLYVRSIAGIAMLPRACRPSIHAARLLYAEIGREVEKQNYDSVSARAVVSTGRKCGKLFSALVASAAGAKHDASPALPEAQFLIEAVLSGAQPRKQPQNFDERAAWLHDLFTRLEKQQP